MQLRGGAKYLRFYRVPPNVQFEVEDMEEEWTYPDNYFDYIHMRSMSGSFMDWDKVIEQAYK